MPNSRPDPSHPRGSLRLVLLGAGVASLLAFAAWQSWSFAFAAEDPGEFEVPDLGPSLGSPEPEAASPSAGRLDRGSPRPVAVEVESLAALLPSEGPGRGLELLFRRGRSPARAEAEILMGPGEGRRFSWKDRAVLPGGTRDWRDLFLRDPLSGAALRLLLGPREIARRGGSLRVDWARRGALDLEVFGPRGDPLEGAVLRISGREARSDAAGRARFEGLIAGLPQPLLAEAPGLASRFLMVEPPDGGSVKFKVVFEEGRSLRGVVLLPPEEAAKARLALLPLSAASPGRGQVPWFWKGRFRDLPIDARGRFACEGLPSGLPLRLVLVHPRAVLEEPVRIPGNGFRGSLDLRPRLLPVLRGVVRGSAGRPLAGALLEGAPIPGRGGLPGTAGLRRALPVPSWIASLGRVRARSDEAGRYLLGLPGRRTEVRVRKPGFLGQSWVARGGRSARRDFTLEEDPSGGVQGEPEGGAGDYSLSLRFPSAWTGGERRILSLRFRFDGRTVGNRLIDPREGFEIRLERPALLRVLVKDLEEDRLVESFECKVLGPTRRSLDG